MKVLFIPDVSEYGGAYNSFCEMVYCLHENHGVEPIILTARKGKYVEFAKKNGFEYLVVKYRPFYLQKGNTLEIRLAKFLVLPFLYVDYMFAKISIIKKIDKNLDIASIDLIHSNVNRDDVGAILSNYYCIPHVWHLREPSEKNRYYSFKKNFIEYMNNSCMSFIAISDMVKEEWEERGIQRGKIIKIYNGIDTSRFYHEKKDSIGNTIKIVMAGRIALHKGQIILLKAIALLPEKTRKKIKIDFYGSSEFAYQRRLDKFIKQTGIGENISFYEYDTCIEEKLTHYDIGLMCSNNEGFGRVTVEYMLAGLCVIASDSGANPEIIEDGVTGLLYKNNNEADLASVIETICNNKDQIRFIGKRAQEIARIKFSREQNADKVYGLYKSLLDK